MDPTQLRETLARIVTQLVDQHEPIHTRDDVADYLLDLRDAVDDIRDRLDELDDEVAAELERRRIVTKRCGRRGCGIWVRVADTGRERVYCGPACRQAARRAR